MKITDSMFQPCPWCRDTLTLEVVRKECDCKQHDWVYVECQRCGSRGPELTLNKDAVQEDVDKTEQAVIDWFNTYVREDEDDRK